MTSGGATSSGRRASLQFPERCDAFMKALTEAKIAPHINLVYTNRLYDGGKAPFDEEGFAAYARYAAELVKHYPQLRSVEVWNEWNSLLLLPGGQQARCLQVSMIRHTYVDIKKARPR